MMKSVVVSSLVIFLSGTHAIAQDRTTGESLLSMDPIIERCGGGISLTVDGTLQGQIADAYGQSDLEGDEFVLEREAAIFSDATASERIELLQIFTDCIKFSIAQGTTQYVPAYPEPTEKEMLMALHDRMGGFYDEASGSAIVQNPINGMEMVIDEFEKHQCRVSTTSTGYVCTYSIRVGVNFFSNEGTRAGDDHARAVNMLFGWMSGGANQPAELVERRFFMSGDSWFATDS